MHTHRRIDFAALVCAVFAVSFSGPIMAATDAPALAIAFWRNTMAAAILLPFLIRGRHHLLGLSRRHQLATIGAGVLLGIHFATWIPSLRYTSIAASTAIVSTQVVWAALLAFLSGHRAPRREWMGIALALTGVVTLTGIDVSLSATALTGDLLALTGAVAAAAYMGVGQRVRSSMPLTTYTAIVYASSAATLGFICLAGRVPFSGYSANAWMLIVLVTVVAQFGGHSLMNMALRSFSATAVSISILFEMPGSTLIGWVWPGQTPPWSLLPAAVLIGIGTVLVIRAERPRTVDVDGVTP